MSVTRLICSCDMLAMFSHNHASVHVRCMCSATFSSRIKRPNKIIYRRKRRLLEPVRELVGFLCSVQLPLHLCRQTSPVSITWQRPRKAIHKCRRTAARTAAVHVPCQTCKHMHKELLADLLQCNWRRTFCMISCSNCARVAPLTSGIAGAGLMRLMAVPGVPAVDVLRGGRQAIRSRCLKRQLDCRICTSWTCQVRLRPVARATLGQQHSEGSQVGSACESNCNTETLMLDRFAHVRQGDETSW